MASKGTEGRGTLRYQKVSKEQEMYPGITTIRDQLRRKSKKKISWPLRQNKLKGPAHSKKF